MKLTENNHKIISLFLRLFLISHLFFICNGVLRPRGVPLSSKIFYNPSKNFSCLDGSGTFPFYFVNDDFCDCEDGSDEPGTAACSKGVFICNNHGHVPATIPSSRVNDGICDCCDASDEYNSSAECLDNCRQIGLAAYDAALKVYEKYVEGNETRQSYVHQAKELKQEYENVLKKLLDDEHEALKVVLEKQDLKDKAQEKERAYLGIQKQLKEEQERRRMAEQKILEKQRKQEEKVARKVFAELDVNKDGKVTFSEVQSFSRFDYDGDGKVCEKEAKFYMHKKDELSLEEFLTNGWRMMKPAYMIEDESGSTDPMEQIHVKSFSKDSRNKLEDFSSTRHQDIDENERNAVFEDAAVRQKEYADANKILQDIQSEIWNVKKKLNMDFGPEDEFLILNDHCFDFSDKRYIYRLCPFDKAVQIFKHNQDELLLGIWSDWEGSEDKHSSMSYTRGHLCWNGPTRSSLVNMECGLENKVLSVVETSTCTYRFDFATPASCKNVPSDVLKILNTNFIEL